MMKHFPLTEGITTRDVTRVVRDAHKQALREFATRIPSDLVSDEEVRRNRGERRYVFGIHTGLRSTLTAHYVVGSGEIGVVFPNDYKGWDRTSVYDQLLVRIYDLILHHSDLRDKSQPAR